MRSVLEFTLPLVWGQNVNPPFDLFILGAHNGGFTYVEFGLSHTYPTGTGTGTQKRGQELGTERKEELRLKRRESLSVFALSSSLHSVFFALSSKYYHSLRLLRFNSLLALASSFSYVIYSSLRLLAFLTRYSHRAAPAGIISFNCCILSHLTTK
jgi:hypothetical protein